MCCLRAVARVPLTVPCARKMLTVWVAPPGSGVGAFSILVVVLAILVALLPYQARGGFQHSPPIVTATVGCDADSEDAHPPGSPIKRDCEREGRSRVGIGAAGLIVGSLLTLGSAIGVSR